ncbi:MAG: hypothetical protein II569_05215 [Paludibacteraceae bacterium]|nr:hypothetical protein [Paludibacteraceae bacterium]
MITIVLFAVSISLFANDNPDYKPWKSFNNDSISYLKENFDNNEYYVGKPINELLNDLELQIKCAHFLPNIWGDNKLDFSTFYFEKNNTVLKFILGKKISLLPKIDISFEPVEKEEYEQYDTMVRNARNRGEVNLDTEWELFGKAFIENRIITKISVPDVIR